MKPQKFFLSFFGRGSNVGCIRLCSTLLCIQEYSYILSMRDGRRCCSGAGKVSKSQLIQDFSLRTSRLFWQLLSNTEIRTQTDAVCGKLIMYLFTFIINWFLGDVVCCSRVTWLVRIHMGEVSFTLGLN